MSSQPPLTPFQKAVSAAAGSFDSAHSIILSQFMCYVISRDPALMRHLKPNVFLGDITGQAHMLEIENGLGIYDWSDKKRLNQIDILYDIGGALLGAKPPKEIDDNGVRDTVHKGFISAMYSFLYRSYTIATNKYEENQPVEWEPLNEAEFLSPRDAILFAAFYMQFCTCYMERCLVSTDADMNITDSFDVFSEKYTDNPEETYSFSESLIMKDLNHAEYLFSEMQIHSIAYNIPYLTIAARTMETLCRGYDYRQIEAEIDGIMNDVPEKGAEPNPWLRGKYGIDPQVAPENTPNNVIDLRERRLELKR